MVQRALSPCSFQLSAHHAVLVFFLRINRGSDEDVSWSFQQETFWQIITKGRPTAVGRVYDAFPQWMKEKIILSTENSSTDTWQFSRLRLCLPIQGVQVQSLVVGSSPQTNLNKTKNLHLPPLLWKEENHLLNPCSASPSFLAKLLKCWRLLFNQVV